MLSTWGTRPRARWPWARHGLIALLIVALVAGLVTADGMGRNAGGLDATERLAAARALAPKQVWGSGETGRGGDSGRANQDGPTSLQAKFAPVQPGGDAQAKNAIKVESGPSNPTGFDPATSKELPERRTETERTFANRDGTLTTEFGQNQVNYRAADGTFQPIDTALVENSGGKGWHNAADRVGVDLASRASNSPVVTVRVDQGLSFGYAVSGAASAAGQVAGSTVTYPNVRADSDLKLDVVPGGVKETVVLRSTTAPRSWLFPLKTEGLTPVLVDGRVSLRDAAGTERAQIPAGSMSDSSRDPQTGDAATSNGVHYSLVSTQDGPALKVDLDEAWLSDPSRQYPVLVDPSVETAPANNGMVVQNGSRLDGGVELKAGTTGSLKAASYIAFDGIQDRLRDHKIFGVRLSLFDWWSWSCQARPVSVHPVTAPWGASGGFPGPAVGPALAESSFAHGYIGLWQHASSCPGTTETIDLGIPGRDLVQRWVTGAQPNYGLSIRASESDPFGWKKFTGNRTANPPRLFVTHSAYDAQYRVDQGVPNPPVTRNQAGKVKITVTNRSAQTWGRNDFALGYRAFTSKGAPVASVEAASLPNDVPRGASVTLEATIKPLEPGDYLLDFSMLRRGGPWFTDEQIAPARLVMTVFDIPPIVKAQYPPNGYSAPTLTPQLWADAVDVDAPVNSTLKYRFEVCADYVKKSDGSLTGVSCVDSGYVAKRTWNVPVGALRWSRDYQWRVFAFDGHSESEKLSPSHLLTAVPQPEITSHLANSPYGGANPAFDPQVGNYYSSAVDASVVTTGPELTVARTYNSLDPRSALMFGAGWSTRYDMRVVPDADGSGNVVVTYPDGQQVRFGRNADGTFAPPQGRQADFRIEPDTNGGGWVLVDKGANLYQFRPDGRVASIFDKAGHRVDLDWGTPDHLKRAISRTSDRILYFTWTGNHVTSVSTDLVDGKQLTWNYTYDGDKLTQVCDPNGGCTRYDYGTGSHYRSSVIDSGPASYWRMGETSGTAAASQVTTKLGKDNGTYRDVTLGQPGPLATAEDTAASFNGTSSVITLPDGTVRKNRDLSIEMWFKTTQGGPLFGYQRAPIDKTPTGAVPVLYVGTDGKLRGQFWNGGVGPIATAAPVNDDTWHHVVLSGSLATQTLYLDGQKVGTANGEIDHSDIVYNQIGAAYTVPPSAWPGWGTQPKRFFNGQIDEVAFYEYPVGPTAALSHFQARRSADTLTKITLPTGRVAAQLTYDVPADRLREYTDRNGGHWALSTPVVTGSDANVIRTTRVQDPGNRYHFYDFDPQRGRILRYIAPLGLSIRPEDRTDIHGNPAPPEVPGCDPAHLPPGTTCGGPTNGGTDWVGGPVQGQGVRTYDYDDKGFQTTVTDELGGKVTLVNDARGNIVSRTSCRTPGNCQTSYYSYYLNPDDITDPRNDQQTSSRDARSASKTDPKYATTFSYTGTGTRGLIEQVNTPDGGVVRHTYTTGSEAAVDGGAVPAGLHATMVDTRNGITRYAYYANGDLAARTDPSGLITKYTYDPLGRILTETQVSDTYPAGVTTTYRYDALSRRTGVTSPAVRNPVTGITHTEQVTTGYDADGNPVREDKADLTGGDPTRTTITTYDPHGRPESVKDPTGATTYSGYDGFGNLTSRVDAGGNKYEYAYTARNAIAEIRLRAWHGSPVDTVPDGEGGDGGDPSTAPADTLVLGSYGYDIAGRLTRQTDAMGRTLHYSRYTDDRVQRISAIDVVDPDSPNGARRDIVQSEITYDAAGNAIKDARPDGRVTTYTYDAVGRRTSEARDPDGLNNRTDTTYNPAGDVTSVTKTGTSSNSTRLDYEHREGTSYTYDPAGRQTTIAVHNASVDTYTTTQTFDQRGLLTASTDPRGTVAGADPAAFTTSYRYDELGRPNGTTEPPVAAETDGKPASVIRPETAIGYNAFSEPAQTRDANGHVSTTSYDLLGRVTETATPSYTAPGQATGAPAVTRYEYDALGHATGVTNPRGATTRHRYDQLGRLVETTDPNPEHGDQPGGKWRYTYTPAGEQLSVTNPTGARTEATYDGLGRQITATQLERYPEPAAYTTAVRYDDNDNPITAISPTNDIRRNAYDKLNQRIASTDPAGVVTQYGYNATGTQVRQSDGSGKTVYRNIDGAGRATATYELDPGEHILRKFSTDFDRAGNTVGTTDALNRTTTRTVDSHNRTTAMVEPVSDTASITTTYGYDPVGNRTRVTDGRGNPTITTYNTLNKPESVIEPATQAQPAATDRTWTTSYDLAGNPTTVTAPGGVTRNRTFDARNQLTQETGTGAAAQTQDRVQKFDLIGRLASISNPNGEQTFTYNDRDALLTATSPVTGTTNYAYDGAGRLTSRTGKTGTATFGYVQGRLNTQTDNLTGTTQTINYDTAGRPKTIAYGGAATRTLTYDDFGRQATDTVKNTGGATVTSQTYGYDFNDRLTTKDTTGPTGPDHNAYTYDYAGRLASWTNGTTTTPYEWDGSGNRTKAGDTTATFDERNRQLTNGTTAYAWSPRGTLDSVTTPHNKVSSTFDAFDRAITTGGTTYGYDGLDRTVTRNNQNFDYDGTSLNLTGDGASHFARGANGDLLANDTGGAKQLAVTDTHDDVVAGLDPTSGTATSATRFDPFGQPQTKTGNTGPLGFQSDYTDPDTSTVDMGARWYTPNTGTFTRRDDIALPDTPSAASNRYTYGNAAPTTGVDPDGHYCNACRFIIGTGEGTWGSAAARGLQRTFDNINKFFARQEQSQRRVEQDLFQQYLQRSGRAGSRGSYGQSCRACHAGGASMPSGMGIGIYFALMAAGMVGLALAMLAPGGSQVGGLGGRKGGGRGGRSGAGGGHRRVVVPPPPPPPGLKAREDAEQGAVHNPDPIPPENLLPNFPDGIVSSNPNLPAQIVAATLEGLQDALTIYDLFKNKFLDPDKPVIGNAAQAPVSPLLPAQVPVWDDCGGGVTRDNFNGGTYRTGYGCVTGEKESQESYNAVIDPDKYLYFLGRVTSGKHNTDRSIQNVNQFARIGVRDNDVGVELLDEHLRSVVSNDDNVARRFSTEYGSYEVRDSLLVGPYGLLHLETTWEVNGRDRRLTTIIPKGR